MLITNTNVVTYLRFIEEITILVVVVAYSILYILNERTKKSYIVCIYV